MSTETITGKDIVALQKEVEETYRRYVSREQVALQTVHQAQDTGFSKLIVHLMRKIQAEQQLGSLAGQRFFEQYMSIKVLQLVHNTWLAEQGLIELPEYSYTELPDLAVLPGVFSPKYAIDSYLWAKYMVEQQLVAGKRVLEMGAGSGIISLYLQLYGAPASVTAADISEFAVENMQRNITKCHVDPASFSVRQSDLYSAFTTKEKFDVIFWAYVWLRFTDEAMLEIINSEPDPKVRRLLGSVIDPAYAVLQRFLVESREHLAPSGKVLLITSDFLPNDEVIEIARSLGYSYQIDMFTNGSDVVQSVDMVLDLYQITLTYQGE